MLFSVLLRSVDALLEYEHCLELAAGRPSLDDEVWTPLLSSRFHGLERKHADQFPSFIARFCRGFHSTLGGVKPSTGMNL